MSYTDSIKTTGYGGRKFSEFQEEVIKIPVKALYDLHLPKSVEILRAIPPENRDVHWTPEATEYLYLHIRSPFSSIRLHGASLCFDSYDHFLERYKSFLQHEQDDIIKYQALHQ